MNIRYRCVAFWLLVLTMFFACTSLHAEEGASSQNVRDVVFSFDISASLAPKYVTPATHARVREYLDGIVTKGWDGALLDPRDGIVAPDKNNILSVPLLEADSQWSVYHFGDKADRVLSPQTGVLDRTRLDMSYPVDFKDQNTRICEIEKAVAFAASDACGRHHQLLWVYVSDDIPDTGVIGTGADKDCITIAAEYDIQPLLSIRLDGGGTSYKGGPSQVFIQILKVEDRKCKTTEALKESKDYCPDATAEDLVWVQAIIDETNKVFQVALQLKEKGPGNVTDEMISSAQAQYNDSDIKMKEFDSLVHETERLWCAIRPLSILKILLDSLNEQLRKEGSVIDGAKEDNHNEILKELEQLLSALSTLRDKAKEGLDSVQNGGDAKTADLKKEAGKLRADSDNAGQKINPDDPNMTTHREKNAQADDLLKETDDLLRKTDELGELHNDITAITAQLTTLTETGNSLEKKCDKDALEEFKQRVATAARSIKDVQARTARLGVDTPGIRKDLADMNRQAVQVKQLLDKFANGCPRCWVCIIMGVLTALASLGILYWVIRHWCCPPPPPPPPPIKYLFEWTAGPDISPEDKPVEYELKEGEFVPLSEHGVKSKHRPFDIKAARDARIIRRGQEVFLEYTVAPDSQERKEDVTPIAFKVPTPVDVENGEPVWLIVSLCEPEGEHKERNDPLLDNKEDWNDKEEDATRVEHLFK